MKSLIIKKNTFLDIFISTMFSKNPQNTCEFRLKLLGIIPVMIICLPIVCVCALIILFSKDKYTLVDPANPLIKLFVL